MFASPSLSMGHNIAPKMTWSGSSIALGREFPLAGSLVPRLCNVAPLRQNSQRLSNSTRCSGGPRIVVAAVSNSLSPTSSTGTSKREDLRFSGNANDFHSPLVKICGITTPEDASMAAQFGAFYVGMLMWPHTKRSVRDYGLAREICAAAREYGAEPVGVFVSESAAEIEKACDATGLSFCQLHGDGARASVLELSRSLNLIYVLQADQQGRLQTKISPEAERFIDWILVDSLVGGSGKAFSWKNFIVPPVCERKGWLLAGGLNPDNVSDAISSLRPDAVDVCSGIAGFNGIQKDRSKVLAFMRAVKSSSIEPKYVAARH